MTAKNKKWFIKVRGSYLPNSWQGWFTYLPFCIFLITVVMAAVRNENSVSDALYIMFPYFVCSGVVMHWIASQKS